MMRSQRERPFIWVTWLTKLLVGENSCEWAAWFKAHYQRKPEEVIQSTFDSTTWRLEHTALLNKVRSKYERMGYTVTTEQQNKFFLRGQNATLSGMPDLIAVKDKDGIIIDVKAAKGAASHPVQVETYMWAVPQALLQHRGVVFSGVVAYQDSQTPIPSTAVNGTFVGNLTSLIKRVSDISEARKVPSIMECRFCDITHNDCPQRATGDERIEGETDLF